jgi:integrase
MRRTEVSSLEVGDIDSKHMMIGVERVKGGISRDLPLSPGLLRFDSLVPSRLESEIQCAAANPKPNSRTMTACQRITGVQRITPTTVAL